ncbi:ABC transporter substrate-binding protein [Paenibacillus sp. GSMTC-2017]|uniref:nickel ABC transporter substrate-binding protein n=1 Tax=Paenibacillus sp. GSMTC-2017 TaxID=2794350 RepID=UPI0018D9E885|nr:nickel ABC transporter substrate-binding protein [Paenibacillus sp. GSMTC-2017]MBH5316432.1 ABC transporter substrate-binding protein [Paenibacillus sp. GSMTC-2017]
MFIRLHDRKRIVTALLVMLLAMVVTACSLSNAKVELGKKKVTIIHSLPNDSLDPHNTWIALRAGVTETLIRLDANMQLAPWLATSWEAKDETTWVFTIRDGVQFQDGTKLDAATVKSSFERGIKDSKALEAALKVAGIEASGQQLTITTKEPFPAFPTELVHPTTGIISVAAEQKVGKDTFNNAPVGTGPFKVMSFEAGNEIHLERFDTYWDGIAKLAEVVFTFNSDANVRTLAFQSKQADIVYHIAPESLAAIEKDKELTLESVSSLRTHYFTYNPKSPNVSELNVRQAIDKLIDRDAIVKDIMFGYATPSNGPFNPTLSFGNRDEYQKLDQVGALQLLIDAGYEKGNDGKLTKDGKQLTLKLMAFTGVNPELPLIPLLVQSEAAKVGIKVDIVSVEYPDVYIADHSDWDISTSSYLTSPRGDGGSFLNAAYVPGGSYNAANIKVEGLTSILDELNRTGVVEVRNELTKKAVSVIKETMPHSYIINPNILVGVNARVSGWEPTAEEFYIVTNKMDVN